MAPALPLSLQRNYWGYEIDPVTISLAFAGAKAAVSGIKELIKLGKDVNEIGQGIVKYFEHKSVIEKAEVVKEREQREANWNKTNGVKNKKTDAELTAEAFDIVMKKRELQRQEYELYELLIWSGQGDVWRDMCAVRDEMKKLIAENEAITANKKIFDNKKAQEQKELKQDLGWCAFVIGLVAVAFYAFVDWGISKGLWK